MKYILISALAVFAFSGCVTDKAYGIGKTIYVGGKAVVIQNADMLDENTLDKLRSIDDYATRYDKARGIVKKSLEKNTDVNSSK